MTKEYYEGMFGSLKHNILCMLSQIKENIKYSDGADISKDINFIKERCDIILEEFASLQAR